MNDPEASEGMKRLREANARIQEFKRETAQSSHRRGQIELALFIACTHLVSVTALVCSVYLIVRGHPWFGLGFLITALLTCPHGTKSGGRQ